jgi:hypothetical protein
MPKRANLIKDENILIMGGGSEPVVKLIDFGEATFMDNNDMVDPKPPNHYRDYVFVDRALLGDKKFNGKRADSKCY